MVRNIDLPVDKVTEFCRRHHIRKLGLFGSVMREDFRADSDVDVLVDFEPQHVPGFIALYAIEQELSQILGGRKVDLVTEKFLNERIRRRIMDDLEIQYAAG